ncbi:MAG: GNAT family N-acetyltransferase [Pirellulales bacterium]|nr:GNAT family N-acetyltransferase [Pirellulales bacterium]
MDERLEIRVADDADRVAALRNAWEFWGRGLSLEEYVERRLKSPLYGSARRYVGLRTGEVVVALAAYDRSFYWHGQIVPGIAIGSVHTRPDCRGQGHAAALLDRVAVMATQQGAKLSVLYCDIAPQYYTRRGYLLCPAWQGTCMLHRSFDSTEIRGGWRLVEFSPEEELEQMARFYAADHGSLPWAIARSPQYWEFTLEMRPLDDFFWLEGPVGRVGYARLARQENQWHLADWAIATADTSIGRETAEESLYRLLILEAQFRGYTQCGGWLPGTKAAQAFFKLTPRREEITMVRPLDQQCWFDDATLAAADRFCYLDHV